MGAEPDDTLTEVAPSLPGEQIAAYCRAIESHLCQKNDGHLIRVVGPSFDLVSGWASDGVPLKVAFEGINRYFERYYRQGPRRRPVRIDSCAADVLDVFDEWRRAIGIARSPTPADGVLESPEARRVASLPAHLERVLLKLSTARATGVLGSDTDALLDRISTELDAARSSTRGLRGEPRRAIIERLALLDEELMETARRTLDEVARRSLDAEADRQLEGFRSRMTPDQFARARRAVVDRLLRERLGLPSVAYS